MRKIILILLAALFCSVAAAIGSSNQEPKLILGAYYYPWYFKERWTNEPVSNTPQLGWYSSGDRQVARQHIRWAKEADLDFFLVSWLSPDGYENRNLRTSLLPELEAAEFRFAILYESPLALRTPAGKPIDLARKDADGRSAGDRFVEHFDYLGRQYLSHPQYLRHGGKAVVTIYLVRDLVGAGPYLTLVRGRLKDQGIELFLIADVVYWQSPEKFDWKLLTEHFQAITAYNMHFHPKFLESVARQYADADQKARSLGLKLVPNVMPGYDDTPLRGMERVTIHRRRGQFLRDYWAVSERFVTPDQPFLLITSFNEWHEGTEIEPSKEHGDAFLSLTRELASGIRRR